MTSDVAQAGDPRTAVPGRRRPRLRGAPARVVMAIVAVTTLVLGIGSLMWGGAVGAHTTALSVVDHGTGKIVYERQVEVGETFELRHTHSVTGREIVETFSVLDEATLAIEELLFDEHGPNLPAGPQHVGDHATYETDGDLVRVRHHGQPIGSLPLMIGSESVDHTVTFEDGSRLRLLDEVRRGSRVEVRLGGGDDGV